MINKRRAMNRKHQKDMKVFVILENLIGNIPMSFKSVTTNQSEIYKLINTLREEITNAK